MTSRISISGREIWLVTCEGPNKKPEIIGIISSRRSTKYVKDFVEQQYINRFFSLDEKVALALGRWKNPYRIRSCADPLICGGNPFIEARIVKIKGIKNGELEWAEIPIRERAQWLLKHRADNMHTRCRPLGDDSVL